MPIVAVRDVKMSQFNNPMAVPSLGVAQRSFQDEVNRVDPNNTVNKYPADFALYHIGFYDTDKGILEPFPVPDLVVQASDLVI